MSTQNTQGHFPNAGQIIYIPGARNHADTGNTNQRGRHKVGVVAVGAGHIVHRGGVVVADGSRNRQQTNAVQALN